MNNIKCFDTANEVIKRASDRFSPVWGINEQKLNIFKQYCSAIDSLSIGLDAGSIGVSVDDISMHIYIGLECDELTVDTKDHVFNQLAKRAISCQFALVRRGVLMIRFEFPSIWDKA